MKTIFPRIPLAFLALCLPALAFPTAEDPEFKKLFDIQEDIRFTARFGPVLLEIPAAEIPAFRASLAGDLNDKKIPGNHASRALGLTDTRWAESDTPGFIAAVRAGLKDPHRTALLRAACLLLDSDIDAAIQTARDFGFSYDTMEHFALLLAKKDPQRAFALYKERVIDSKTSFDGVPMFLQWADIDAAAAWAAITEIEENKKLSYTAYSLRSSVSVQLARRDLPTVLRLIDSMDDGHTRARITQNMISSLTTEDASSALDICRRINTKDAWMGFARALHTRDDRETIRILLESLPPAHLHDALAAFFSCPAPMREVYRNTRLIPLLEDPVIRRKAILALVQTRMEYVRSPEKPLPDEVIDAALAMVADILGPAIPLPQRQHLLRQMLARDPMAVLPWILSLSRAEHSAFDEVIRAAWPDERLSKDIPALLAHESPRARALAYELLGDALRYNPADVLATAIRHAPERIAKEMNIYNLHEELAEDFPKAEAQLREITDPAARAAALRAYALWGIENLPAEQAKAMAQGYLQKNPNEDSTEILTLLAMRLEEEFDNALTAIPSPPDQDRIRGLRAKGLYLRNEEDRALQHLKDIRSDGAFFSALNCLNENGQVTITRWDDFIALIAARPNAEKQKDVIDLYARKLVESQNDRATQFVDRISIKNFREAFSTAVALRMPPTKDTGTWAHAMKLGLATEAGRTLGVKAVRIMVIRDPKSAIKTLLQSGPEAMRPEFVQPVMEKLVLDDPPAAFALLKSFPPETSGTSLSEVLRQWSRIDPQAASEAVLSLSAENAARYLGSTLASWLEQDAPAARSWVLSLPQGPARQSALTAIVQQLSSTVPHEAAELFLTEFPPPLSDSLANRIVGDMARISYPAACQFIISLEGKIEARRFSHTWQSILRDWSASDPESAERFLETLPDSSFVRELRATPQGTARNPGGEPGILNPLHLLRKDTLHRQTLPENTAAALRQAVIQPANQSTHLSAYCVYLLRRNQDASIPQVLKDAHDLAKQQAEQSGYHAVPYAVTECIRHLLEKDPQRIPAFLDFLAAGSPDWLEPAVAALWSRSGNQHGITPLMASALLRIAPEKRARHIAAHLSHARPLPEEWAAFLLDADPPDAANDPHASILLALTKNDLPAALHTAALLPVPQGDPLVRAILAAFPSREDAANAILTLPPATRPRVQAWHDALNPLEN